MSFITDPSYYYFLLVLILSFPIGGLIIGSAVQKILSNLKDGPNEPLFNLLLGMGLSPFFIALLLNYFLWIIPAQGDGIYLTIILLCYTIIAWDSRAQMRLILQSIQAKWFDLRPKRRLLLAGFGVFFLLAWSVYLNYKGLTEHDTLEYAVQGKMFYETKHVSYDSHNYDPESGFYYVGLHGYTFPLLASWERIWNGLAGVQSDFFFRSINSIYGILILLSLSFVVYKASSKRTALFFLFGLIFSYGFFETILKYHIDLYRIFFLSLSLIGMYFLVRKPSMPLAIILGIFLGAQANAHSLGALLYIIQVGVIFLFLPLNFQKKLKFTFSLLAVSLLFGSIHYVFDVIWGTGWIFQEIKFY